MMTMSVVRLRHQHGASRIAKTTSSSSSSPSSLLLQRRIILVVFVSLLMMVNVDESYAYRRRSNNGIIRRNNPRIKGAKTNDLRTILIGRSSRRISAGNSRRFDKKENKRKSQGREEEEQQQLQQKQQEGRSGENITSVMKSKTTERSEISTRTSRNRKVRKVQEEKNNNKNPCALKVKDGMIVTCAPTSMPTSVPTIAPSMEASKSPSTEPSMMPSVVPSIMPSTTAPTMSMQPSVMPTISLSQEPSLFPTEFPSLIPSTVPSDYPSQLPSSIPSLLPSDVPSFIPSITPSDMPSQVPSILPSLNPTVSMTPTRTSYFTTLVLLGTSGITYQLYECREAPPLSWNASIPKTELVNFEYFLYQKNDTDPNPSIAFIETTVTEMIAVMSLTCDYNDDNDITLVRISPTPWDVLSEFPCPAVNIQEGTDCYIVSATFTIATTRKMNQRRRNDRRSLLTEQGQKEQYHTSTNSIGKQQQQKQQGNITNTEARISAALETETGTETSSFRFLQSQTIAQLVQFFGPILTETFNSNVFSRHPQGSNIMGTEFRGFVSEDTVFGMGSSTGTIPTTATVDALQGDTGTDSQSLQSRRGTPKVMFPILLTLGAIIVVALMLLTIDQQRKRRIRMEEESQVDALEQEETYDMKTFQETHQITDDGRTVQLRSTGILSDGPVEMILEEGSSQEEKADESSSNASSRVGLNSYGADTSMTKLRREISGLRNNYHDARNCIDQSCVICQQERKSSQQQQQQLGLNDSSFASNSDGGGERLNNNSSFATNSAAFVNRRQQANNSSFATNSDAGFLNRSYESTSTRGGERDTVITGNSFESLTYNTPVMSTSFDHSYESGISTILNQRSYDTPDTIDL